MTLLLIYIKSLLRNLVCGVMYSQQNKAKQTNKQKSRTVGETDVFANSYYKANYAKHNNRSIKYSRESEEKD